MSIKLICLLICVATTNGRASRRYLDEDTLPMDLTVASSASASQQNPAQKMKLDDDPKTLSQQVADGKYGLIHKELFSNPAPRPGVLSYDSNSEVPKDTLQNLGGLNKSDIWLAENHLLVLKGGVYPVLESLPEYSKPVWPPIDDYSAPRRQVKLPKHPKVPPPFPVQLTDGGPLQILGTNFTRTLNDTVIKAPYPVSSMEGYDPGSNPFVPFERANSSDFTPGQAPIADPAYDPQVQGGKGDGGQQPQFPFPVNGVLPPFFDSLPPGSAILPPPNITGGDQFDEDDLSIYYPPPYSFYYPTDNTTHVPPGPLVPGIVLPPPPDFFGILKKPTESKLTTTTSTTGTITTTTLKPEVTKPIKPQRIKPVYPKTTTTVSPTVKVYQAPRNKSVSVTILRPVKTTIKPHVYVYENDIQGKPFAEYGPPPVPAVSVVSPATRVIPSSARVVPSRVVSQTSRVVPGHRGVAPNLPQAGISNLHQASPGIPGLHHASPGIPNRHQTSPGISSLHQAFPGIPSLHQASPGIPSLHQASPGIPNLHQTSPGISSPPQTSPGVSNFSQAAPRVPNFLPARPASSATFPQAPPTRHRGRITISTTKVPLRAYFASNGETDSNLVTKVPTELKEPYPTRTGNKIRPKPVYYYEDPVTNTISTPYPFNLTKEYYRPKEDSTSNPIVQSQYYYLPKTYVQQRPDNFKTHIAQLQDHIQTYQRRPKEYKQNVFRIEAEEEPQVPSPKPVYQYSFQVANYREQHDRLQVPSKNRNVPKYTVQIEPAIEITTESPVYHQNPSQQAPVYYQQDFAARPQSGRQKYYSNSDYDYSNQAVVTPHPLEVDPTPNPVYQAFYTKQDEQLFDDITKKYFTTFGKKLPTSTTPIPGVVYSQAQNQGVPAQGDVVYVNQRPQPDYQTGFVPIPRPQPYPQVSKQAPQRYQAQPQQNFRQNVQTIRAISIPAPRGTVPEGKHGSFISYELPGDDGAHFYFLTPQLTQKADPSDITYYYSQPSSRTRRNSQNERSV